MKYIYEINQEIQTIIVVLIGNLETKEMASLCVKILLKAKELKYNITFDCRLSRNQISITAAYYWYVNYIDPIDEKLRLIPISYISNKEDLDFYSFF